MMAARSASFSPAVAVTLKGLFVDAVTAEVAKAFDNASIRCILLKGPSVVSWLYSGEAPRSYVDTDLLVAPGEVATAGRILSDLGFERRPSATLRGERPYHEELWERSRHGALVDLHWGLTGVPAEPTAQWQELSRTTEVMTISGVEVEVLSPPARSFHVAVHAAQHGRAMNQPLRDLERALQQVPDQVWRAAAEIATRLDSVPLFAGGLRMSRTGIDLASRLELPLDEPVDVRLRTNSAPRTASVLEWLAQTPGIRAKARLIARKTFPPRDFMRNRSRLARRGRVGLVLAYLWRPLWLSAQVGPALIARRRARKQPR